VVHRLGSDDDDDDDDDDNNKFACLLVCLLQRASPSVLKLLW
jgi:hypothetical protein